jgi:16S rRNA (uracil1498-N3)-methyltransferase
MSRKKCCGASNVTGSIRLYTEAPLATGVTVPLSAGQAHYLKSVMRRAAGGPVCLFNGADGEWQAHIEGNGTVTVSTQLRSQAPEPDRWLVFAPVKRDATDLIVRAATELGVSRLVPILTQRSQTARINADRWHAIAVEAAEQCERLSVPAIAGLQPLPALLTGWDQSRALYAALERQPQAPASAPRAKTALLIGPEGGFADSERKFLANHDFVQPFSLGARILRAETAAIAGLARLDYLTPRS